MTTTQATGGRRTDKAQYGLAAVLAVVGVWTIIDARGLNVGQSDVTEMMKSVA